MILAIDTSGAQCAVALAGAGQRISRAEPMERGHAERLFPMIEAVLAEADVSPTALERVAVCTGPGSFTGIRVGIAAARGLAFSLGIPAVGISRFEALAGAAPAADRIVIAARAGLVYVQALDASGRLDGEVFQAEAPAESGRSAGLVDPLILADLAEGRPADAPPSAFYLRGADAAPPAEMPPRLLD